MITRILVPVDLSDLSLQALDYAIEFGRPFKPELVVLHVLEPIYYPGPPDMYGPGYDMDLVYRELERAAREQLARVAATLQKKRLTCVRCCALARRTTRSWTRQRGSKPTSSLCQRTDARASRMCSWAASLNGSCAARPVRW